MVRIGRLAFLAIAYLFLVSIVVQFFVAGLGLFVGEENFELHGIFGFTAVHGLSLLLPIAAAIGRTGRRTIGLGLLLFVLVTVQVTLPGLREGVPLIAALHPVNALLIFWLALRILGQARTFASSSNSAAAAGN
jgi:hypothetical protein